MAADSLYLVQRLRLDPTAAVETVAAPTDLPALQRVLDEDDGVAVLLRDPAQTLSAGAFELALAQATERVLARELRDPARALSADAFEFTLAQATERAQAREPSEPTSFHVQLWHPGDQLKGSALYFLARPRPPAVLLVDPDRLPVLDARTRRHISTLFGLRQAAPEPVVLSRSQSAETPAIAHRDALLASEPWSSSTEVAARARAGAVLESNPHQYASRLRRERRLFGVRFKGAYLHPDFQFLPATGEPHPRLPELLALLPDEDHGWAAAFWLFAPTRLLDGARPADVFRDRPDAVIAAARRAFEGDDADW